MFRRRTALSVSATAGLLAAAPLLAACGGDAHPGAAAIVDGKRITVSQLQAKVKDVRAAQAKSPQGDQLIMNTGRLSLATLNGMIFDEVLARGAHDAGVTVTRRDVQRWRAQAEKQAGGADRLKEMWLQQGIAPDEIDAMVRNQLLLDGVAQRLGADRGKPEGQQKLAQALAKTSRSMGIDVNPRFGKWDDHQVILGETKDPWITREPAKQQA
ncbi:SurA N-terminal domain-containing protein [Streptomyces sp. 2224.1]|uniref:SurA N-terminal domain-containing protein n=1 Tax=unclassified Streptomyces TaxID=2593676 RepID=UPI000882DA75|nr:MULTISPECIES: SurA N-terminal domain-containing protein [unclassified Streptomyces]PBC82847.1 SurA-like protein [Streptomyces sp. 2321.6]SDR46720.1 SurA N-terminal domain-containing protein [Streptomyces sp. KS_16]SEC30713.1 SurA N-terminal domain-containing protein [Streptomyces sp. 2224.1]SEC74040.1 SurA N-terminal domain-containing protein [Streptomyces sp. 2133.1]SEE91203.1 SurA N-terminal domain-containing protein [Streptomyces sp. 2112.3]